MIEEYRENEREDERTSDEAAPLHSGRGRGLSGREDGAGQQVLSGHVQ